MPLPRERLFFNLKAEDNRKARGLSAANRKDQSTKEKAGATAAQRLSKAKDKARTNNQINTQKLLSRNTPAL